MLKKFKRKSFFTHAKWTFSCTDDGRKTEKFITSYSKTLTYKTENNCLQDKLDNSMCFFLRWHPNLLFWAQAIIKFNWTRKAGIPVHYFSHCFTVTVFMNDGAKFSQAQTSSHKNFYLQTFVFILFCSCKFNVAERITLKFVFFFKHWRLLCFPHEHKKNFRRNFNWHLKLISNLNES